MKEKYKKVQFEVECFDINNDGKGVVRYEGVTGFIDDLLIGEKALIETTYRKKDVFYGKVINRIITSKDRIKPICPYFNDCGGCKLMHMNYNAQLKYKKNKVNECLKRIGSINTKVNDTIGMNNPYNYRNKIQMPIKVKGKNIVTGFYKEKTHDIVPIDKCYIENKEADHIIITIKSLMKKFKIEPYNEDKRKGVIRHILIKNSKLTNENMVVLVTNIDSFPGRNDFIKQLKKLEPSISTIVQNINTRDTNVILGEKERILSGKGYIIDELCGIKFKISPKSFYQINPFQTEKLYSLAIDSLNLTKNDLILDAYCGIGTIGLIASKKVKQVIGVEIESAAVKDAINNAKNNNINNALFFCGDAGDFIVEQYKEGIFFDAVIMDPPRKGSTEKFLDILIKTKPKKIAYISCDPATLARDLKYLSPLYDIVNVTPVDMFPHTSHVETIVLLSHRKADDYVEVEIDTEDFPITSAELKATYQDIIEYISKKYNVKVTNLEIAQMKQKYGIKERECYNKGKDNSKYLQPKCTKEKENYILDAFRYYKMI